MPSLKRRVQRVANRWLRPFGVSIQRAESVEEPLKMALAHLVGRAMLRLPADRELMLVQVGANDGSALDPVVEFLGSPRIHALLVEPLPGPYRVLQERWAGEQDRVRCANVAIADTDGEQTMYVFEMPGPERDPHVDMISSFDRAHMEKHQAAFHNLGKIEETTVPTRTFDGLLADHNIDRVDILQIDTEGFDAEILRMADIPRRLPMVVAWEHIHLPKKVQREWWDRMKSLGYELHVHPFDTLAERLPPIG